MAEELNMHFSSVFSRQDISALPKPVSTFNGPKLECVGSGL